MEKMKCQTRKELLEKLNELIWISSEKPVFGFTVDEVDSEDYYILGWDTTYYDLDGIVSKLMDLSLTHKMVKIRCQEHVIVCGITVCFVLAESNDGNTNIDSEMIDLILRLNCKKFPLEA